MSWTFLLFYQIPAYIVPRSVLTIPLCFSKRHLILSLKVFLQQEHCVCYVHIIDRKHWFWLPYFFRPNSIYTWLGKEQLLMFGIQLCPFTASIIHEAVQRKKKYLFFWTHRHYHWSSYCFWSFKHNVRNKPASSPMDSHVRKEVKPGLMDAQHFSTVQKHERYRLQF